MFLLPAKHHIPEDEAEQVMTLKFRHHDQVSALTQYLWEDYLRNSDVGEAAKIQAAKEEEEHKNLVINNEKLNTEIASKREGRLKIEATEEEKRIKSELHFAREQESKRLSVIEKVVVSEKEQLGMRIKTVDDLERAILSALDNPVDNEFAIDKDGHIYRGRYTKSIQVPLQEREKIPIPLSEGDMILGVEKQQENV
jgi:small subunit ribosomal protein S26